MTALQFRLILFGVALSLTPVIAQEPAKAGATDGDVRQARVTIDGETLFSLRGVSAYPAERRAREVAARIRAVAANPAIAANSVKLEDRPPSIWITVDGTRLLSVFDEDAALEETTRDRLAEIYRARISEAIEAYRRDRMPDALVRSSGFALGATLLLAIVAWAGHRFVKLLHARLEARYRARLEGIQERSQQIVRADQIWRALNGFLNATAGIGIAVMVFAWLNYVLGLFPWTRPAAQRLFEIAIDPLKTVGLGLIGMIPNLVFLAVLILLTRTVLRIIRVLFDNVARGSITMSGFDPEWSWPTYRLVRILVVALSVVVAYPYIPGSNSEAFKGVSLFMGIIFSLGSSSLIGNLIAGYSMTYRRAFKLGDRVRIGQNVGDVSQMRLMVTHLRTPKNEEIVVPNSVILGAEVVNYSSLAREQGLILHTTVGIGYETPWRQVEAMLVEAATRTKGLLRQPPPFVLQTLLGDFCVTYEINAYCDTPQKMAGLYAELHRSILDVFNEYGVQIMTPAYENDTQQPKIVPPDQWYMAPAKPPIPPESAFNAAQNR